MITPDEFIEDFLAHKTEYDPVKAHEYYVKNRKLKGRKKGINEDEVPERSPSGSKLLDFSGDGGGRAIYEDGSTFDANGWNSGKATPRHRLTVAQRGLNKAKVMAAREKDPKRKADLTRRLSEMQTKLDAIKRKQLKSAAVPKSKPVLRRQTSR